MAQNKKSDSRDNYYQLGTSVQNRFSDLPVPNGFVFLRKKSFVFQNNDTRMGTLFYTGKATFEGLTEFYKQSMTENGWDLTNIVEFGKTIMNFEKGSERCVVTIDLKGVKSLIVSLSFSPSSSGAIAVERPLPTVDAKSEKEIDVDDEEYESVEE